MARPIRPIRHNGKPQDLRREQQFLEAAHAGKYKELHRLIKSGVDIDTEDENGMTALAFAALQGKTAGVRLLLAKGADFKKANISGTTPLFRAAARGHVMVLRILVQAGADLNARNYENATPLHVAARGGFTGTVEEILRSHNKHHIDIDARDNAQATPLLLAAQSHTAGAMMLLIDKGADMTARDKNGKGLMENASPRNKTVLLEMLAMQQAKTVRRIWRRKHRHNTPAP